MALYATEGNTLYLARGKDSSTACWERSNPQGLIDWVGGIGGDNPEAKKQFRRCVRYLKKWKQEKFHSGYAPASIGLTILAGNAFAYFPNDDFSVLLKIVAAIENQFKANAGKIIANVPVDPWDNVFDDCDDKDFGKFETRIESLSRALINIKNEPELTDQCQMLQGIFGNDFPGGKEKLDAKKVERPFIITGENA